MSVYRVQDLRMLQQGLLVGMWNRISRDCSQRRQVMIYSSSVFRRSETLNSNPV